MRLKSPQIDVILFWVTDQDYAIALCSVGCFLHSGKSSQIADKIDHQPQPKHTNICLVADADFPTLLQQLYGPTYILH